jgi:hypothetical protein
MSIFRDDSLKYYEAQKRLDRMEHPDCWRDDEKIDVETYEYDYIGDIEWTQ